MTELPKEIFEGYNPPAQPIDRSVLNTSNLMFSKITNGKCTFGHQMTYEILVTTVERLRNDTFGRWFYKFNSCPVCSAIHQRCCSIGRMTGQFVDMAEPGLFEAATKEYLRYFKRYYEDEEWD